MSWYGGCYLEVSFERSFYHPDRWLRLFACYFFLFHAMGYLCTAVHLDLPGVLRKTFDLRRWLADIYYSCIRHHILHSHSATTHQYERA
jgi:hypothetical protein